MVRDKCVYVFCEGRRRRLGAELAVAEGNGQKGCWEVCDKRMLA